MYRSAVIIRYLFFVFPFKSPLRSFLPLIFLSYLFTPIISVASESSDEGNIDRLLDMSLEELIEVEVSIATKTPKPFHMAPAIATVITAREIKNMGALNLLDVLKMVPGLNISRNEQGFFMFDVRGVSTVSSEKILFMVDGHSLNNNYAGSGLKFLADHLSVLNIKQIEIVRGPGSALYGNSAFVASVNVITKDTHDLDGFQAAVSGGSFDTANINFQGGKDFDNDLKVFGSVNYYTTNGPDQLIAEDRLSGTPWTMTPGDADTSYASSELLLKLTYKNFAYEGQYLANDRGAYIGFANALTDNNTLEFEHYWQELRYRHEFNRSFSTKIRMYWDQFEQDASVELMPSGFMGSYPDGMIGGPKAKDRTLGSEIQLNYDLLADNHVLVGFLYEEMKQYDVKSISNFNPLTLQYLGSIQDISAWGDWNKNTIREDYAAYIQDDWQMTDTLNLTAGLRYDHYSDFGDTTNPRAAMVWNFIENAEVKLLYGEAFRAPSLSELYNINNPSLLGNPDLEPETIKTYEAAVGYRFLKHIRLDVNYFYNEIEDIIVRDNSTSPAQYGNLGGAQTDGIELVLTGDYSLDNYWRLSYSHSDPEDTETGDRLAYVPNDQASLSFNYAFTHYLVSHMDILWIGARPRPAGDSRADIDAYTTVDLALTLRNVIENMEIQGVIHNLLDADYSDPDLSGASMYIPGNYPRAGISAIVTISYKF